MHLIKIISLALCLSLLACTPEKATVSTSEENTELTVADRSVSLSITGMVCEMGCGGSIRKALKKTNSVTSVKFDFVEERAENTVQIAYNSATINPEEIIRIIKQLNDGQFDAQLIKDQALSTPSQKKSSSINQNSDQVQLPITISEPSYHLPNLIDVLAGLF